MNSRIIFFAVSAILLGAALANPAVAQQPPDNVQKKTGETGEGDNKPDGEKRPSSARIIAPYDAQLMRLAEILGSIHYLRNLCGADEKTIWREQMNALIISEKPEPERKAKMISRFNRGYNTYKRAYLSCTPSALAAIDRYVKEGVRLTNHITTRYGS